MNTITVKPNQSMPDVIIQASGSLEAGMAFCSLNNVAVSDTPAVGTVYKIPPYDDTAAGLIAANSNFPDTGVLLYLGQNGIVIGTLGQEVPLVPLLNDDGTPLLNDDGAPLFNDND